MTVLFWKLLDLSISASWLVLVVLAFRLVFQRAPKWIRVLLWGMVALRLMLPFSIESSASLQPRMETVRPTAVQADDPTPTAFDPPVITSEAPAAGATVSPALPAGSAPVSSTPPTRSLAETAGSVWLFGLAAMLGYALVSFLRLRQRVKVSLPLKEGIYLCDAVPSPFILGIVRPRTYLPSGLNEAQTANILAHERAHLSRYDHWWKPLGFALLAVYWFNPLLWLAYILFCRDIELACDEKVIRHMDKAAVKTYSAVLLSCSMPRKINALCPLAFGEVGVKERIQNILHYKRPALWMIVLSLAACAAAAVCFLTSPKRESMQWAQSLLPEDVVNIELVAMPQSANKQYRVFSAEEIADVTALINESKGRSVSHPQALSGGSTTLYVTTADGVCHTVSNEGNVYLRIDGDTYKPPYNWLSAWPYTEGNAPLPEGFFDDPVAAEDAGTGVMAGGRFYTKKWSIQVIGDWEPGGFSWQSSAGTGARLYVDRGENLNAQIWLLKAEGTLVEETDRYYRYIQPLLAAPYHSEHYLYPIPNSEDFYAVDISWNDKEIWESGGEQLALEKKQLKLMAESFQVTELVNDLPVRPLTGYEAYDALIAAVADSMAFAEYNMHDLYDTDENDFSSELLHDGGWQTTGWTLRDLDGDGTPELILGGDWGDGYTPIYNLYKLEDGKAVRVLYGWTRNRYLLCTNGTIAMYGDSGIYEYCYSYYRYTGGELKVIESVQFLASSNGWSSFYYSDTSDEFRLKQPNGDWASNPAYHTINEQEAERIVAKYEDHVTLDYTPFTTDET